MATSFILDHLKRTNIKAAVVGLIVFALFFAASWFGASHSRATWALKIIFGIGAGVSIIYGMSRLFYVLVPSKHPSAKWLGLYGPVDEVTQQVDAQLDEGYQSFGSILWAKDWIVEPKALSIDAFPLTDVVWVYDRPAGPITEPDARSAAGEPKQEENGTEIVLHRRTGAITVVTVPPDHGAALIQQVRSKSPVLALGFNESMMTLWKHDHVLFMRQLEQNLAAQKRAAQQTDVPNGNK